MTAQPNPFANPTLVEGYASETPRKVPGLADLHRMASLLLAEQAGAAARMLVVGAGGGLELRALAEAQPGWRFVGVDPSAAMLDIARQTAAPFLDRIELLEGFVADAPTAPCDGATCLLTLHFLNADERLETLKQIRHRLRPGAALVVAHHSRLKGDNLERWLARSIAFGDRAGLDPAKAAASAAMMAERLPLLTIADDEALLAEAGFTDVSMFYAALSFRGWVAVAA